MSEGKKTQRKAFIAAVLTIALVASVIVFTVFSQKSKEEKYNRAVDLMVQGRFDEAADILKSLGTYSGSTQLLQTCISYLQETGGSITGEVINSGSYVPENAKPDSSTTDSFVPESSAPDNSGTDPSEAESSKSEDESMETLKVEVGDPVPPPIDAHKNSLGLPLAVDFTYVIDDSENGYLSISGHGAMPIYLNEEWDWKLENKSPLGTLYRTIPTLPWLSYMGVWSHNLREIRVEEGITVLTDLAFHSVMYADKVYLPHSLQEIDEYALSGLNSLTSILYNGTREEWKQIRKARNWDEGSGLNNHFEIICIDGVLENTVSPYCGESAMWIYDEETRTVTIWGKGHLDEYWSTSPPWTGIDVSRFVVMEGITSLVFIGDFEGTPVESFEIPASVERLDRNVIAVPADELTIIYHGTKEQWEMLLRSSFNYYEDRIIRNIMLEEPFGTTELTVLCDDGEWKYST